MKDELLFGQAFTEMADSLRSMTAPLVAAQLNMGKIIAAQQKAQNLSLSTQFVEMQQTLHETFTLQANAIQQMAIAVSQFSIDITNRFDALSKLDFRIGVQKQAVGRKFHDAVADKPLDEAFAFQDAFIDKLVTEKLDERLPDILEEKIQLISNEFAKRDELYDIASKNERYELSDEISKHKKSPFQVTSIWTGNFLFDYFLGKILDTLIANLDVAQVWILLQWIVLILDALKC
ncbi:hypothetical protein [Listeria booriae]|uniref:hypothetical protein n=1 Tax=Listeria booriae TaxID=1552123 RepID=UPI001628114D|nr:hypothetical protein [Listeria booriae]MBC2023299.1 hypothetical protein [Listeria booriae]